MKIAVCQIKPLVGDIEGNFDKIKSIFLTVSTQQVDLCIFPELVTSGYLAKDLFLKPAFIEQIHNKINELVNISANSDTCLLLPTAYKEEQHLYNAVIAIRKGEIIGKTYKHHLPNYGVFDEKRYFTSGTPQVIEINGIKVGLPICEDIWFADVCKSLKTQGAEIFLVPNGSPYDKDKYPKRLNVVRHRFLETQIPLLYCNQVIGQDGIIFDGKSFAYDGHLHQFAPGFTESVEIIELIANKFICSSEYQDGNKLSAIYQAMVLGTHDYIKNNGFTKVILGLSGGIDSALVACVCADAIGSKNVTAVMLPSKFSASQSKIDAVELANNLGINLIEIPISEIVEATAISLGIKADWQQADLTLQNIQSRARGIVLMALSNKENALLITTGNKSEYATGYATIYGDMNGAFNPIKDLYKIEVYDVCRYRNSINNVIPESILQKEPSAELTLNQKDSDTLPNYEILDEILELYIEDDASIDLISQKFSRELVERIVKLVKVSEFKRQQSAPGVKISSKAFDLDRRYPITNCFKG